jgi:hypothetical protein
MKYIVVRAPSGEQPILFPRAFLHSYAALLFRPMQVVAAGFVRTGADGPECYGLSAGLNIRSRPERDTALVRQALSEPRPGG